MLYHLYVTSLVPTIILGLRYQLAPILVLVLVLVRSYQLVPLLVVVAVVHPLSEIQ
jgi:hypothetical protein